MNEQNRTREEQLEEKCAKLENRLDTLIAMAETLLDDRNFCQRKALELDKLAGERREKLEAAQEEFDRTSRQQRAEIERLRDGMHEAMNVLVKIQSTLPNTSPNTVPLGKVVDQMIHLLNPPKEASE